MSGSARVYVGNLPTDIKESEIDDLFYKYDFLQYLRFFKFKNRCLKKYIFFKGMGG